MLYLIDGFGRLVLDWIGRKGPFELLKRRTWQQEKARWHAMKRVLSDLLEGKQKYDGRRNRTH